MNGYFVLRISSATAFGTGGTLEFVQILVNLPAQNKGTAQRTQIIGSERIPVLKLPDHAGTLRLIAGETREANGPAQHFTPINLWEVRLRAGRRADLSLPSGSTLALFVLNGRLGVNETEMAGDAELAIFSADGEEIVIDALKEAGFWS